MQINGDMNNSKGTNANASEPNHLLHLILSRLPTTEEVICTNILLTRWRHLWTSVPFIDTYYSHGWKLKKNRSFEEFVSEVLVNKSIDLGSFRLHWMNYVTKYKLKAQTQEHNSFPTSTFHSLWNRWFSSYKYKHKTSL
uniref:F-box domain-containing protein n=1 Tax=Lactuca sativa TaxID=4236 RepID=A0A9R1VEE8_LACSA|nr:hypothetical protein LSAT_V11C500290900 [Lactuca sativa]